METRSVPQREHAAAKILRRKSFSSITDITNFPSAFTSTSSYIPSPIMSYANTHVNVAMLTAGGLAPCLSSSIAALTQHWVAALKSGKISGLTVRMYTDGYKGLLQGESFVVPDDVLEQVAPLHDLGGSPIGNSRVKVSICSCGCGCVRNESINNYAEFCS